MSTLRIADSFSLYPGLRHCDISDDSGEEFYHKVLNEKFAEAFQNSSVLEVDIDGTAGYAPSFLDEAFGNLVFDFSLDVVKRHLVVKSDDEPSWLEMLATETFPQWEQRRHKGEKPKKTSEHAEWFRLENDSLIRSR
jgi:hypothetical protein